MSTNAKGFTLVECMISMVIVLVGLSAMTTLLTICLKLEKFSRELARANFHSRSKIEELANSTSRVVGGNLASDVPNYFDNPTPDYVRRWKITSDPMGTQTITVVMIPVQAGPALSEVRLITRLK